MTEIKEIGSLCAVDDKGYIINEADVKKINIEFWGAIQAIKKGCLSTLSTEIHSIYIRGSVPRGVGIEGVSDLDAIVITHSDPENLDLGWIEDVEQSINQRFPIVNGVEMGFYPLEDVNGSTRFSIIPFMLKTHSICVYGEDLKSILPNYKADRSLANDHLIHIKSQIEQARHDLKENEDKEDIQDCCTWIMKNIVRSGLALVIVEERSYSRDLYPAFKLFSKHYPEKEEKMRTALEYAIEPVSDPKEILNFLNHFGEWLIGKAEIWIEFYNQTKEEHLPL